MIGLLGDGVFIIDRKLFRESIQELKDEWDFENDLNDVFKKYKCYGYLYRYNLENLTIRLLARLICKEKEKEIINWIDYFCWELDFGEKYKTGDVLDENNNPIDMGSVDALYTFLEKEYMVDKLSN